VAVIIDKSLRNIEWGSEEFDKRVKQAEHEAKVNEDMRRINRALDEMETDEGWRYIIGRISGH